MASFMMSLIASLVIYAFVLAQISRTEGDHALHASSYEILRLWEDEDTTIDTIQNLLKSLTKMTDVFSRYVESWNAISDGTESRMSRGDPAAIYILLKHVAEGWREVDQVLHETKDLFSQIEYLSTRADREKLPNSDDVTMTSETLAKLAHVYRFNFSSLSDGFIRSTAEDGKWNELGEVNSTLRPLSVEELASIGVTAMNKGYFDIGVDFIRSAKELSSKQLPLITSYSEYSPKHIDSMLRTAVKVHNHVLEVRGPRSLTHTTASSRLEVKFRGRENQRGKDEEVIIGEEYLSLHDNKTWMLGHRALVELQQIERLCRGEDLRRVDSTPLSCSYLNSGSPWLLLAPFKMEVVSLDPHIAIVYEVITSRESQNIKTTAQQSLHTQQVAKKENAVSEKWSPKQVWLENKSHESLQHLSRRLSHIAKVNIDVNTSEPFMVANYGIGGEYEAHRDTHGPSRTPPDETIGDRMATIVTYLEAPQAGGRLVFPWVGASVQAIDGAAVIWWNLLASHEHDFLTIHASCPILTGHKWITSKWIGYNAQWSTHPCPVDPSKKMSLPG